MGEGQILCGNVRNVIISDTQKPTSPMRGGVMHSCTLPYCLLITVTKSNVYNILIYLLVFLYDLDIILGFKAGLNGLESFQSGWLLMTSSQSLDLPNGYLAPTDGGVKG